MRLMLFFQLPPPIHGVTAINDFIYRNLNLDNDVSITLNKLQFSDTHKSLNKISIKKILYFLRTVLKLFIKLSFKKTDYVYFTITPSGVGFIRDLIFLAVFKLFNVELILHFHGVGVKKKIMARPSWKLLYRFALSGSHIIHLSEHLMDAEIIEFFSSSIKSAHVIPNGIAIDRSFCELSRGMPRVLFMSNLFKSKGVIDAIKVFEITKKAVPDAVLDIVGASSGPEMDAEIDYEIKSRNLENDIFIHGFLKNEDKKNIISNCQVLLHPTHNDALPLVILEAMAFGKPVISTFIGAIEETIDHGENGFLAKVGDIESMSDHLVDLLSDDALYQSFSTNANNKYSKNYTSEIFLDNLKDVFLQIMKMRN